MKIVRPILVAALMSTYLPAQATSFDCNRGHSLTEKMICTDPALSKLDDALGQLYWKARRRVANRRAFLNDSDSKWAWREANCRDAACLSAWYATRIDELERLIESMRSGTPNVPAEPLPLQQAATMALQCTAANPGIVLHDQCSSVLKQNTHWRYEPHGGDWFCGLAMVGAGDTVPPQ
jgi:uncharacterized protein